MSRPESSAYSSRHSSNGNRDTARLSRARPAGARGDPASRYDRREHVLDDVAGAVAATLRELDHDPVVVGGSAATLHAPEAYRSADIDMVVIGGIADNAALIARMASIGFLVKNGLFIHERSPYTVDFVPSPVAIAGDVISDFASLPTAFGSVRVLHAVDVVNDRLNKYVAYEDPESFEVAVAVARMTHVDLERVNAFVERQAIGIDAQPFRAAFARLRYRLGSGPRDLSSFSFSTAFRVRFRSTGAIEVTRNVARGIEALLDEERSEIDPVLEGIKMSPTPMVMIDRSDPSLATIALDVSTKRDLAPVDRFALATAIVDHARSRIEAFPEIAEILEDGTPPVATTGF